MRTLFGFMRESFLVFYRTVCFFFGLFKRKCLNVLDKKGSALVGTLLLLHFFINSIIKKNIKKTTTHTQTNEIEEK